MTLFQTLMTALMAMLALSMALAALRLLSGPSIPDRAAAFDTIMVHVVGIIAIYVVVVGQTNLLDSIIVVAALGFLGTVALARYIEGGQS